MVNVTACGALASGESHPNPNPYAALKKIHGRIWAWVGYIKQHGHHRYNIVTPLPLKTTDPLV